jgi:hypothetical protein
MEWGGVGGAPGRTHPSTHLYPPRILLTAALQEVWRRPATPSVGRPCRPPTAEPGLNGSKLAGTGSYGGIPESTWLRALAQSLRAATAVLTETTQPTRQSW